MDPQQSTGPLTGHRAVVVGGSRGIGRAIVTRLAADGARVVFGYASNQPAAAEVEAAVKEAGGEAVGVRAELADLADVAGLFLAADRHFGGPGLDILVNSAGIPRNTPIGETEEDAYDRVMAVNAKGPFFAMQHAARRMATGGRIVNVSTVTTRWPRVPESVYAASKAALEQFTRIGSRELGPRGITVNTVSPGPTDTEMLRGATTDEIRAAVAAETPLGRLGRTGDIAAVVAFLVGPDAGWVTGQNILADGGLVY